MVTIGGFYKHFKGDYYVVEDVAFDCETQERVVVYRSCKTGKLWVRKESDFCSVVDKEKYPNSQQDMRFEYQVPIKDSNKEDLSMFRNCNNSSCDFNVNLRCSRPECDNPNYKTPNKNIISEKVEDIKNKIGYCKEK